MIFECPPEKFHFDKASIANFVDLREKSLEWEVPRAKEAAILLVARGLIRVGDVNQADASTMLLQPSWPFRIMTDVVTVKDQLEERVIELPTQSSISASESEIDQRELVAGCIGSRPSVTFFAAA